VTLKTLVGLVYESIQNPQKRNDFLAAFAEIIDASAAAIALEDRQLRWSRLYLTHGMDRETIDSYTQYHVSLNPWAGRRTPTVGEVRTGDEVLSVAEFRDTEFYHGWFKPRGWLHASSIIFETTETERTYLFSMRPPNHPFTEKELDILKELGPHLHKAAQRARQNIAHGEINQHRSRALEMDRLAALKLSPREYPVALALSQGQTAKEYAYKTGLAVNTVQWHRTRIYKKLGIRRRADLVRLLLG
jgi:DNA-binding CsgD family transcriptional regulator